MRVVLDAAAVNVHVGVHPWERHPERPTRLTITAELFVPLKPGPVAGQGGIVDYDHLRDAVLALQAQPHVAFLETIVDQLLGVAFRDERVFACRIAILKPDIFNEAKGAGIDVFRTRAEWAR